MPPTSIRPSVESTDVALIGAGPIGLELAAALKREGFDYLHFEAAQIASTIFRWPPATRFFSSPERIIIAGIPFHTPDQLKLCKEDYLAYLRAVVEQLDLKVRTYEPVVGIERSGGALRLCTRPTAGERSYRANRVVLATGGMAGPNRLGVPGEDLAHVSHNMDDPHKYFRTRVLVVGGMNSALEAALRCFRAGADVTIAYRREELGRGTAKKFLLAEVMMFINEGKIRYLPQRVPVEITPSEVVLAHACQAGPDDPNPIRIPADFVLLCTGFVADMRLFAEAGVLLRPPRQVPQFDPATLETNVPGLYVAGTAAGGTQAEKYQLFIETCHDHVDRIVAALSGRRPAEPPADPPGAAPSEQVEL